MSVILLWASQTGPGPGLGLTLAPVEGSVDLNVTIARAGLLWAHYSKVQVRISEWAGTERWRHPGAGKVPLEF